MGGIKWSKEEKEFLKKEYPLKSAEYISDLIDRSKNAIYIKADEMGIESRKCGSGVRWTQKEIDILKEKYPIEDLSKLSSELGRSKSSIKSKAEELGIKKRKELREEERKKAKFLFKEGFNVSEISKRLRVPKDIVRNSLCCEEILEMLYFDKGLTQEEIGEKLNSNQPFISEKMREKGIKTNSHNPWTIKEEKILEENYLEASKEELLSLLPTRTWSAIKAKAMKLGVCQSFEEYRNSDEVKKKLRSLAEKNKIDVDFCEKETLAYILGVIDGDGFHDREHTIGLEVKSPEFADKFAEKLKKLGLNPGRGTRNDRDRETVWASSGTLVEWYLELSKEEKLKWLEEENLEWNYIEGRYESDGNIHPSGGLRVVSYDKEELDFLEEIFSNLEIRFTRQKYNLWIPRTSAKKFFNKTNLVLRNMEDYRAKVRC